MEYICTGQNHIDLPQHFEILKYYSHSVERISDSLHRCTGLQKFQLHRDVRQKKQLLKELRHEIPQLIANGNTLLVSKSKINYKFLANTLASIQHLLFLLNLFHEMKMLESLIEKIEQILKRKTKKNN